MTELFVNVKNETRNANNERTKFDSSNYSESVAFIEKSGQSQGDEIWAKNKFYQFVPNDTNSEGKILTKTNVPENSGNAATINSEGDGRGEWDNYLSFEDRFSYGVEWQVNDLSTVSRIGNPQLHEDLPIQNEYRGCYYDLQNKKVLYWYDPENWENVIPSNIEGNELYAGKYPAFNGVDPSYNTSQNYPVNKDDAPSYSVMVHTPKFYGKSGWYEKDGVVYNWVRISPMKIAGDWVEIPEMFVSAYHATIYNSGNLQSDTRENMLRGDMNYCKAVSVQNESDHYKGGGYNGGGYDLSLPTTNSLYPGNAGSDNPSIQYQSSNGGRNGLPRTGALLKTFHLWCKNNNTEMLYYDYYKWIFFWNYVIEYCNFNCQKDPITRTINNESVKNKAKFKYDNENSRWIRDDDNNYINIQSKEYIFSSGGLGQGLSGKWPNYSDDSGNNGKFYSGNKCGDCNSIGNNVGWLEINFSGTWNVPKWRGFENPFGNINTELNGIYIETYNNDKLCKVYTSTNSETFDNSGQLDTNKFKFIGYIDIKNYSGPRWINKYSTGLTGEILPVSSVDNNSSSAPDISIYRQNSVSKEIRKVAVGYRLSSYNQSNNRAGIGSFTFYDLLDYNFYSYYGFRFIVKA